MLDLISECKRMQWYPRNPYTEVKKTVKKNKPHAALNFQKQKLESIEHLEKVTQNEKCESNKSTVKISADKSRQSLENKPSNTGRKSFE